MLASVKSDRSLAPDKSRMIPVFAKLDIDTLLIPEQSPLIERTLNVDVYTVWSPSICVFPLPSYENDVMPGQSVIWIDVRDLFCANVIPSSCGQFVIVSFCKAVQPLKSSMPFKLLRLISESSLI